MGSLAESCQSHRAFAANTSCSMKLWGTSNTLAEQHRNNRLGHMEERTALVLLSSERHCFIGKAVRTLLGAENPGTIRKAHTA